MDIYLRALEPDDYIVINKWRNDEKLTKFLSANHFFVSKEREKQWAISKSVDDSHNLYLGIGLKKTPDVLVGYCAINNIDLRNRQATWGATLIGSEYLGNGYGVQSAKLMLKYLFDQYPIHKCNTSCLLQHPRTVRMFEELGFKKDGVLRDELYKDGKFWDVVLFSLLRTEIQEDLLKID